MAYSRLTIQETVQIPVPTPCDLCDSEEDVNSYCRNCSQKLCDVCKKSHLRITTTRDHVVVHISEGPCLNEEPTICREHKSTLTFYCRSCDLLSCPKCLTKHHNGHNFMDTDEYAKEVKNKLSSLISSKKEERKEKTQELKTMAEARENYLKEMDASKRKVKQATKEMRDEIKSIETELLSDISEKESEGLSLFEEERKQIAVEESDLNRSIEKLEESSQTHDNVLLIRSVKDMSREASKRQMKLSLMVPLADFSEGEQKADLKRIIGNLQIRNKTYQTGKILEKTPEKTTDFCRCGYPIGFGRMCMACFKPKQVFRHKRK